MSGHGRGACRRRALWTLSVVVALGLAATSSHGETSRVGGCLALPVYLDVPLAASGGRVQFDVRVYAWNPSRDASISITGVDLGGIDPSWNIDESELPRELGPREGGSILHLVPSVTGSDVAGLVSIRWTSTGTTAPIVEATMLGTSAARGFAILRGAMTIEC